MSPPRSRFRVGILFVVFFVISLLTNIIGPLIPDVIREFKLSLTMAAFLPFSFFIAYGVLSVPSGMMVERTGEKPVMLTGFGLALAGSLLFSLWPAYLTAIVSLFLIGLGMAALQVAINPLLRVSGGEENFAFNSAVVQLIFGLASFVSPLVYSVFVTRLGLPWNSIYWVFSVITVLVMLLIFAVPLPRVDRRDDEKTGAWSTHAELLRQPVVWAFVLGVFCYVGLEQGLSNWMSQDLATRHGVDPQTAGAAAVSNFWGLMTVGCLLGLGLLKIFDSRKVLAGFALLAVATLAAALFGNRELALLAYPALGFAISMMWSIVISLALNSLPRHHGTFSGLLCTGIIGGAVVPLMIGRLGDAWGLRDGMLLLFLPLAYLLSMGFWAKPLIKNKTLS